MDNHQRIINNTIIRYLRLRGRKSAATKTRRYFLINIKYYTSDGTIKSISKSKEITPTTTIISTVSSPSPLPSASPLSSATKKGVTATVKKRSIASLYYTKLGLITQHEWEYLANYKEHYSEIFAKYCAAYTAVTNKPPFFIIGGRIPAIPLGVTSLPHSPHVPGERSHPQIYVGCAVLSSELQQRSNSSTLKSISFAAPLTWVIYQVFPVAKYILVLKSSDEHKYYNANKTQLQKQYHGVFIPSQQSLQMWNYSNVKYAKILG
jgi:hypothetical protein